MAHRRVRRRPLPQQVLVVCHGNIWRSPYAAAVLRRELSSRGWDSVRVTSAGLIGPGRPCSDIARAVAITRGLDLSGHRSRVVRPADVEAADLIVVMDEAQRWAILAYGGDGRAVVVLGDLDPDAVETRAIQDPDAQPREVCERSYARIERCIGELVDALTPSAARRLEVGVGA